MLSWLVYSNKLLFLWKLAVLFVKIFLLQIYIILICLVQTDIIVIAIIQMLPLFKILQGVQLVGTGCMQK